MSRQRFESPSVTDDARPLSDRGSTVRCGRDPSCRARASGRAPPARLLVLLLACVCALFAFSCASPVKPPRAAAPSIVPVRAAVITAAAFRALPAAEQQERRVLAAAWRQKAGGAECGRQRLEALTQALAAAPDDPEGWLALAELGRRLGDRAAAEQWLAEARLALPARPAGRQQSLAGQLILLHAWIRNDLGDWDGSLAWIDSLAGIGLEDGPRGMLLRGLAYIGLTRSHEAFRLSRALLHKFERSGLPVEEWAAWIAANVDMWVPSRAVDAGRLHTTEANEYAVEMLQDIGIVKESWGQWREAGVGYQNAFARLPPPVGRCLTRIDQRPPEGGPATPPMPCWLAQGRRFVAGSWYAYAQYALERLAAAPDSSEAVWWREAALEATTACVQKYVRRPWARMWRGALYARLGRLADAGDDLVIARDEFAIFQIAEPRVLAELGHLRLLQKRIPDALFNLRQAVAADSTLAQAWADIGYAELRKKEWDASRASLERALALDPSLAQAWRDRGRLNAQAKRWPEAIADLERAARLDPKSAAIAQALQETRVAANPPPVPQGPPVKPAKPATPTQPAKPPRPTRR